MAQLCVKLRVFYDSQRTVCICLEVFAATELTL